MSDAILRCEITGNPWGTDTWMAGGPCKCANCQRGLMEALDRLRAELADKTKALGVAIAEKWKASLERDSARAELARVTAALDEARERERALPCGASMWARQKKCCPDCRHPMVMGPCAACGHPGETHDQATCNPDCSKWDGSAAPAANGSDE